MNLAQIYLNSLAKWRGDNAFSLEPITALMRYLSDPQDRIPCAHVAGTNGKGSVTVSIASIMARRGDRVGAYISPHLASPLERIVIDGIPISTELFEECVLRVKAAAEMCSLSLSYFEVMTAVAFLAFAAEDLEFCSIEVGLGGRLDATNVISSPMVSVVTSIDLDHTAILGDTYSKIAVEKAGIIKHGVPSVVGRVGREALSEIEKIAVLKKSNLARYGHDFTCNFNRLDNSATLIALDTSQIQFKPALRGIHQVDNAAIAMQASILCGASVEQAVAGIADVFWPGRLEFGQVFGRDVLIDAAHNPAGARALVQFLEDQRYRNLTLVFGVLSTKDWVEMVKILAPFACRVLVLSPESESAVPFDQIKYEFSHSGVERVVSLRGVEDLIREISGSPNHSQFVVTGSIYMIGSVRRAILELPVTERSFTERPLWNQWPRHDSASNL